MSKNIISVLNETYSAGIMSILKIIFYSQKYHCDLKFIHQRILMNGCLIYCKKKKCGTFEPFYQSRIARMSIKFSKEGQTF